MKINDGYDRISPTASKSNIIVRYGLNQILAIQRGGLPVLARKTYTIAAILLALLPVLLIRALRPILLIRLGGIRSDRIGHFGPELEIFLSERDAHLYPQSALDIFYHSPQVCNQQLMKMWNRTLRVSRLAKWPDRLNRWIPGGKNHEIPRRHMYGQYDINGVLDDIPSHLSFTPCEDEIGKAALLGMGVPEQTPFVCFAARDTAYLKTIYPDGNWGYHDYRNSNILNYLPAAMELVDRGYVSIRMGAAVKQPLPDSKPGIIDYATNGIRSELLDLYLSANCRMFICSADGIAGIPLVFRRPIVFVNFLPIGYIWTWSKNFLFIPKKLWLRGEKRFLTFRETFETGLAWSNDTNEYDRLDVENIENTPEEITNLVIEMDERINGTWRPTDEDDQLQREFWSIFKPTVECHKYFLSRIGAQFLRENRNLLG